MWVIFYLAAVLALLLGLQTVVLLAFKQPLQWTYGASSKQPKSLRLILKVILQVTLIGSIVVFPYLVGTTPAAYYGPALPLDRAHYFLYGELVALALLGVIFLLELGGGWIYWKPRFTAREAFGKSARSALSSLTVVAIEEPFFRAIILQQLLFAAAPAVSHTPVMEPWAAVALSAVLFSAAHFLRKVKTYWPFVGLAVLGVWLGVAYVETGNLWLPMGLHSGGILAIGLHRCFLNYKGPEWLVGTQTYPIAGALAMAVMLIGTAVTWWVF